MQKPEKLSLPYLLFAFWIWSISVIGIAFFSLKVISLENGCNRDVTKLPKGYHISKYDEILTDVVCFLAKTDYYMYFWTLYSGWILLPCVLILLVMQGEMILPKLESHKVQKVE
jgi:hypothetical protein